jgi:hypothetical protein
MAIYLDDGVNVDPSWTQHIAVSADGTNWSTINKHGLNVNPRNININNIPSQRPPFVNKGSHSLISLTEGSDDTQIIVFDPNEVVNQPTWSDPKVAVQEITGWLV